MARKSAELSMTEEMAGCISDCLDCQQVCMETVMHCLNMGGQHAEPGHIRLLLDCAEVCQTAATLMMRESQFHVKMCRLCAEVCRRCAEDCQKFGSDPNMLDCAKRCRKCAESCTEMAESY